MLDNNGYVIISQKLGDTGRFFGEVRGTMMDRLILEKVYQPVRINDYQSVCFQEKSDGSPASILQTPLQHIVKLLQWVAHMMAWAYIQLSMLPAHAMSNFDEYGCKK